MLVETQKKRRWIDRWGWALCVALGISLIGFAMADARRRGWVGSPWLSGDMTDHLGAEYDNIARAVYEGRGFSDPFGRHDGSTAWMPPLLPSILAGLYYLNGGSRDAVVLFSQFFQVISVAIVLSLVLQPFHQLSKRWIIAAITLAAVLVHFKYLFQFTHDHTLLIVLVTVLWWRFSESWEERPGRIRSNYFRAAVSGASGGILALASPILGAVWAVLTAIRWGTRPALVVTAAIVSMAIVAPWVVRNRIVMGHWIPIKSNAAYELWQAQVVDADGIVDTRLGETHPYNADGDDGVAYTEFGEMEFLATKKQEWKLSVHADPARVFEKIVNRASAAFVDPVPYSEWERSRTLAWNANRVWLIISTVSCIFIAWKHPQPISPKCKLALAIWLLTLVPYLICSYYERYDVPVFPMRLFVVLTAVSLLVDRETAPAFKAVSPKRIQTYVLFFLLFAACYVLVWWQRNQFVGSDDRPAMPSTAFDEQLLVKKIRNVHEPVGLSDWGVIDAFPETDAIWGAMQMRPHPRDENKWVSQSISNVFRPCHEEDLGG